MMKSHEVTNLLTEAAKTCQQVKELDILSSKLKELDRCKSWNLDALEQRKELRLRIAAKQKELTKMRYPLADELDGLASYLNQKEKKKYIVESAKDEEIRRLKEEVEGKDRQLLKVTKYLQGRKL